MVAKCALCILLLVVYSTVPICTYYIHIYMYIICIYTYPHECFDGLGSTHRRRSWPARSVPTLNKTRARRHLSGARRKLRRAVYRSIQILYSAESRTAQHFNCTMTCLYVQPPKLRNSNPCPAVPPCESLLECVGTLPSTVIFTAHLSTA